MRKKDWACQIRRFLEEQYPAAEKVILVLDNLNTHVPSAFYEAFRPEKAFAMLRRLEIHYTPKHGSWLNIAEIELSALAKQCLGKPTELHSWNHNRNAQQKGVD